MNNRPRIIPTLLLEDGNLVKTKGFKEPNYLGDPINAIKIFNEKGVDELCILDITASKNNTEPNYELLLDMTTESFMPLAYGGGIRNIDQMKKIFRMGFEKIIVNSAFIENEEVIKQASSYFGSQSVVISVDYKATLLGPRCFSKGGSIKTGLSPIDMAMRAEKAGAGEVLLYSIDRDGKRKGYDLSTIEQVSSKVKVPVIACGGAKDIRDFDEALKVGASAVAAGSMFVYYGKRDAVLINYPKEEDLYKEGIYKSVRI